MSALGNAEQRFERTTPYLKQNQVEELTAEKDRLSRMLNAPPHLRNAIQDAPTQFSLLRRLTQQLEKDTALPYQGAQIDTAVRREAELRERITNGMPTYAEMRRNPPGALEKQLAWQERTSNDVEEWKNVRRRLWAGGQITENVSDGSIANIEMLRQHGGPNELSMDSAQIPIARTYSGLGGRSSVLTDEEIQLLKKLAPKLAQALPLLSADQRDEVKDALHTDVKVATENLEGVAHKELRERCRAAGLETGGAREDLVDRLKAHYGQN